MAGAKTPYPLLPFVRLGIISILNQSLTTSNKKPLPRAIAKEKDGIVMYWVEAMSEGGLHVSGLAKILHCGKESIASAVQAVKGIDILEAQVVTEQGLRTVNLLVGQDLAKLLRYISRSKAKLETRDRADDLRDKLAAAGFKLAVMLELAPKQLLEQVLAAQPETPRQLPPVRDSIQYLEAAKEIADFPDPLIRSLLTQRLMEDLGAKTLPANHVNAQAILTVRASELGYNDKEIGTGSQLGIFVAKMITPNGKTQHGRYPVNVYDLTPELDECIHAYFR